MATANYTLISFDICPFVQRSVITLEEKGVEYEIKYIELENKPDWFLAISPFGKVPVLQANDTVIFESAVINEYLDEAFAGAPPIAAVLERRMDDPGQVGDGEARRAETRCGPCFWGFRYFGGFQKHTRDGSAIRA